MRIFKTRWFVRFARRERIGDRDLANSVARAARGLVDADLGGGLIKQRVARPGQGRSGGYRMLLAYHAGRRAVFLYAFAKNERDNIDDDELEDLRALGLRWLSAPPDELGLHLEDGALQEVDLDDETET